MPFVPASASVWHEPQLAVKIDLPSVGSLRRDAGAGHRADVDGDVLHGLILVLDAESVALDVVTRRQSRVDGRHAGSAGDRMLDREPDLRRDDLGEGVRRHPGLACLRERVVEIRPDLAVRARVGQRVTAAACLDEELLAGTLAAFARVATGAAAGEHDDQSGRAEGCDEDDGPHGRRV